MPAAAPADARACSGHRWHTQLTPMLVCLSPTAVAASLSPSPLKWCLRSELTVPGLVLKRPQQDGVSPAAEALHCSADRRGRKTARRACSWLCLRPRYSSLGKITLLGSAPYRFWLVKSRKVSDGSSDSVARTTSTDPAPPWKRTQGFGVVTSLHDLPHDSVLADSWTPLPKEHGISSLPATMSRHPVMLSLALWEMWRKEQTPHTLGILSLMCRYL